MKKETAMKLAIKEPSRHKQGRPNEGKTPKKIGGITRLEAK